MNTHVGLEGLIMHTVRTREAGNGQKQGPLTKNIVAQRNLKVQHRELERKCPEFEEEKANLQVQQCIPRTDLLKNQDNE